MSVNKHLFSSLIEGVLKTWIDPSLFRELNHTVGPPRIRGLTSFKDGFVFLRADSGKGKNQQRMGMGFRSESEGVMLGFNKAESPNGTI